ncbi:hypothetical protein ACFE04_027850 [Oxalis oulophora]
MAASSIAVDGIAAATLRSVLLRVQKAVEHSDRSSQSIRVVAVSKTKHVSVLRQVYDADHHTFGENYVQELIKKLSEDIEWHLIENLQTNKVKSLLSGENFAMVETIDDQKFSSFFNINYFSLIVNHLDRDVANLGRKPLKVLVQVNITILQIEIGSTNVTGKRQKGLVRKLRNNDKSFKEALVEGVNKGKVEKLTEAEGLNEGFEEFFDQMQSLVFKENRRDHIFFGTEYDVLGGSLALLSFLPSSCKKKIQEDKIEGIHLHEWNRSPFSNIGNLLFNIKISTEDDFYNELFTFDLSNKSVEDIPLHEKNGAIFGGKLDRTLQGNANELGSEVRSSEWNLTNDGLMKNWLSSLVLDLILLQEIKLSRLSLDFMHSICNGGGGGGGGVGGLITWWWMRYELQEIYCFCPYGRNFLR